MNKKKTQKKRFRPQRVFKAKILRRRGRRRRRYISYFYKNEKRVGLSYNKVSLPHYIFCGNSYLRTWNSKKRRYFFAYNTLDRFDWKPRSKKQLRDWSLKGRLKLTKQYKFRKRSVDFAPLAYRGYYWEVKYTNPKEHRSIYEAIKRSQKRRKLNLSSKLENISKDYTRPFIQKWDNYSYKSNPHKLLRNLGKSLLLKQLWCDYFFFERSHIKIGKRK